MFKMKFIYRSPTKEENIKYKNNKKRLEKFHNSLKKGISTNTQTWNKDKK